MSDQQTLLDVKNLKMHFPVRKGVFRKIVAHVRAVDGISFHIHEGETLGLVGESGCGKTTTGRCILRALDPTEGEIRFRKGGEFLDIARLSAAEMAPFRSEMQIIFQDPFSSLNPRMTVMDIVSEPLRIHRIARGEELKSQVRDLLEAVGLKAQHMNRYPYAFSGGQRQRIGIARALALRPKLIVCDEPVSALDVSIQAQVLNLLDGLQAKFGLTYLFIAHNLSVVQHICNRVAVMYLGDLVEVGASHEVYHHPMHPYSEALLSAVPKTDPTKKSQRVLLHGDVPSPVDPPSGCKFHTRCRYAKAICREEHPPLAEVTPGSGHFAACHFASELNLTGVVVE
jgi:peptide/nickel transport system ATP-binding protein